MHKNKKIFYYFALIFVLAAAFLIRLNHLTDRSLWFDEAFSWRLIQFPFLEFIKRAAADVHPILYYIILWIWCAPAAILHMDITLFWLRSLSVLLSVGTVFALYLCGSVLFRSRWIGLTAALLAAVNAFQVQYSWEARMYALGTLLLPLSMALLIKTTRQKKTQKAWLYGILMGIVIGMLFHVHYYTLFSIAALVLFAGLFLLYKFIKFKKEIFKSPSTYALFFGLFLSLLIFLPWLSTFLAQRSQVQQSYWIPSMNNWSIPNTMARLLYGGSSDFSHNTAFIASCIIAAVAIIPLIFGRKRGDWLIFFSFVVPFAGSWYLSKSTSIYQDRYFVFASIALILLFARSISLLPRRWGNILVIAITIFSFYNTYQFWQQLNFQAHPGAVGAAEYIVKNAKIDEPILVSSSFIYFQMAFHIPTGTRYGIAAQVPVKTQVSTPKLYSETGELSHFGGGPILAKDDVIGSDILKKNYPKIWTIDTTGFGGSKLNMPKQYVLKETKSFSELFGYQGDIVVNLYELQK